MRILGLITLIIIILVVVTAVFVFLRSIPDIRRYLKIKAM